MIVGGATGLANSGSDSNAPAALGGLEVGGLQIATPKESPARIELVVADAESDLTSVELLMEVPDGPNVPQPTQAPVSLIAVGANPAALASSPQGVSHQLVWDFASEPNLPDDESFVDGVKVIARIPGGATQELTLGVGNDPPEILSLTPPTAEARGIAAIGTRLRDSSDDVVDVKVEYLVEAEPQLGWRPVQPAGPNLPTTPEFAMSGIEALRTGVDLVFFWDTDVDLKDLERDVRLRFTPEDEVAVGASVETGVFRVDNNEEPIVQIVEGSFLVNPDEARGIPIPYTVIDGDGDPVRVVFQWRSAGGPDFPSLPTDPQAIEDLMADPQMVARKQICTPFSSYARGRAMPVDARRLKLPELQQEESRLLARGAEGLKLELLRPRVVTALSSTWASNPLRAPADALPLAGGAHALVLDGDGTGQGASLVEVNLATGEVVRTLGAGIAGVPTAMAWEKDEGAVLVASVLGSAWQLHRVELDSGATTSPISQVTCVGRCPVGPLRDVLALAPAVALATAGNGLWRLDWTDPGNPRATLVVDRLQGPWGLAINPANSRQVWVAERGRGESPAQAIEGEPPGSHPKPGDAHFGRLVAIDVESRVIERVAVLPANPGEPAFPRPTALAFDRAQNRLVALCHPAGAQDRELRGVQLGSDFDTVFTLETAPPDSQSLALGPAEMILLARRATPDLLVRGGIEQAREIAAYDVPSATVTVASDFDPPAREAQTWRMRLGNSFADPVQGSPAGTPAVFLWESRVAADAGPVLLRATSLDDELGSVNTTSAARAVADRFEDPVALTGARETADVVAADLDGDGDLDLVCACKGDDVLAVHYQETPGVFGPRQSLPIAQPISVDAGDLDRDGDADLVSVDGQGLTIWYQETPGVFVPQPPLTGGTNPTEITLVDLDGDGALDILVREFASVVAWYQDAPGVFNPAPATGFGTSSFAVGDLDRDGDLDIVATTNNFSVRVWTQEAFRSFVRGPEIQVGNSVFAIVAADLDQDGDLDLVVGGGKPNEPGHLLILEQEMRGAFFERTRLVVGSSPPAVLAADLDGDGDLDLACNGGNAVTRFEQRGAWTFLPQTGPFAGFVPSVLISADFEGDGDTDLVTADEGFFSAGQFTVWLQGAPRGFGSLALGRDEATDIAVADLDADGKVDLVGVITSADEVKIWFQDFPRDYKTRVTLATSQPRAVDAADLDGDGDLDLVVGSRFGKGVRLWFQDSPRVFVGPMALPVRAGADIFNIEVGDLDENGLPDLVATSQVGLLIYYQVAPRVFLPQTPLLGAGPVASLEVVDIDADGALDLVAFEVFGSAVVFYQEGPRVFVPQSVTGSLGSFGAGQSASTVDFDGDGDLDILMATDVGAYVSYQRAWRVFEEPILLHRESYRSVAASDIDGDLDLDIVASQVIGGVHALYQEFPGVFVPQRLGIAGNTALELRDVDGDGDVDIVTGVNNGAAGIAVAWGRQ